jgi:hypothetical protein
MTQFSTMAFFDFIKTLFNDIICQKSPKNKSGWMATIERDCLTRWIWLLRTCMVICGPKFWTRPVQGIRGSSFQWPVKDTTSGLWWWARKGNNALGHISVHAFSVSCRLNTNYPRNLSPSLTIINLHVLSAQKILGSSRSFSAPFLRCLFKTILEVQVWVLTIGKGRQVFFVLLFVHFNAHYVQSLAWLYFFARTVWYLAGKEGGWGGGGIFCSL